MGYRVGRVRGRGAGSRATLDGWSYYAAVPVHMHMPPHACASEGCISLKRLTQHSAKGPVRDRKALASGRSPSDMLPLPYTWHGVPPPIHLQLTLLI